MTSDFIIEVNGLQKRYGDYTAVDDLSFAVKRGEILGFLGPNGAGKSTCVKMLAGLMQPDGGEIRINGQAYNGACPKCGTLIGVAPQEIVIWGALTCMEQMTFMGLFYGASRKDSRHRAALLLEAFGLSPQKDRLAKSLSGGMQRRLNIALALVHAPSVLILDEPQAGLDPQSRVLVRDYIAQLRLRTTVILCTHDMEEAEKLTDRVCIIDKGQRLALDTPSNLKKAFAKPTADGTENRGAEASFITLEDVFIGMTGRGLRE